MTTIKLTVDSAEQFRDELPTSGLFDLTDCKVQINAAWDSPIADLTLITTLLEGAINVVNLEVNLLARPDIEVLIISVPVKYVEKLT